MYSGAKLLIQCIELKSGFLDNLTAVHLLRGATHLSSVSALYLSALI